MTISELTNYLETIAPLQLQESYDNSGLIIGNPDTIISSVLVSLDATEEIVNEAIQRGCNLIVAHHPIVFSGLKKFVGENYIQRTVARAIKNDIAIYAIHTNLDNVLFQGVNGRIASMIGLKNAQVLSMKAEDANVGSGAIGELSNPMEENEFLKMLLSKMKVNCIKHTRLLGKPIQKVAVCGGSGSFLLAQAIKNDADVFITSDFKYHQYFDAESKIIIADIGHYESEQFTIDLLAEIISEKNRKFAVLKTGLVTNPVQYFYSNT